MIVYDLSCLDAGHKFEAWFASSGSFTEQQQRGLVQCPFCGSDNVERALSAPRLNRKGNQMQGDAAASSRQQIESAPQQTGGDTGGAGDKAVTLHNDAGPAGDLAEKLAALAMAQKKLLEKSKWVGKDFASQARAMHYGEAKVEQIHGQASLQEAEELMDEGVAVAPLPLPVLPPEVQN
jgi:hypothetical protein